MAVVLHHSSSSLASEWSLSICVCAIYYHPLSGNGYFTLQMGGSGHMIIGSKLACS